jgi:hypothetical protein
MLWQPLVALLRMRNEPDVKVAALGATTVNATNLERVRVVRGGVDITLLIDPASGRVHSTQYFDRKSDGEYGEIALAYGDYRSVEGVLVPFVEKGTFNGMPHPGLTRTLESASVNGAVDAALFTAPAQVAK